MGSTLSQRLAPFGTTIFTEMTLLAQKHSAINLAQGFPDFDGPEFVKAAAVRAISAGQNQYARMFGIPALNQAIAGWWHEHTGAAVDPDTHITVTSGCTEAIAAALIGLINPGDEVILFEPFYDSYRACIAMAGGLPRFVTLRPAADGPAPRGPGFGFDPDQLRAAFSPRTRAILINTPHNPTGKVFSRDELTLIADLCMQHNVVALMDEVYEHLTYAPSRPHISMATLPGMAERTITMSSLGKTFSLTGWKIGWAIAPPDLTRAVRAAHQFLTFSTATAFQHGAAAALAPVPERDRYLSDLLNQFAGARTFLADSLTELGFRVVMPDGAYFIMADWTTVPAARAAGFRDDVEFCRGLTAAAGVAAIPPSVFYQHPERGRTLARFAFCKKQETLAEGVRRLRAWATA